MSFSISQRLPKLNLSCIGDKNVDKHEFVSGITGNIFAPNFERIRGVGSQTKTFDIAGRSTEVTLWHAFTQSPIMTSYRGVQGIFLMYNVTKKEELILFSVAEL